MSTLTQQPETNRETGAVMTVWRYEIPARERDKGFFVEMPAGAEILYASRGAIVDEFRAWVNSGMPKERRYFCAVQDNWPLATRAEAEQGLGMEVKALVYVKSWVSGGTHWHLFEIKVGERIREREPGEEG